MLYFGRCAIFSALCINTDSRIASWDLSDQGIDAKAAKAIAASVAANGAALKALDLRHNSTLDDKAKTALREIAEGRPGLKLRI